MQWRNTALGVIAEQLRDNPYNTNGSILFLKRCTKVTYGNGNYTYYKWNFGGYLYCLDDNMTWMASFDAEKSVSHLACGTYFLPGEFQRADANHTFICTSGSLKKFETALENIINRGHPNNIDGMLRVMRMKIEL